MIEFKKDVNCLWFPPDSADSAGDAPIPVILFLHGAGERGRGGQHLERVMLWGLPKFRAQGRPILDQPFPFLVVAPQCPEDKSWCHSDLLAALGQLLDQILEQDNGDPRRLYVAGFSMGGVGALCLALRQPNRFAAVASVCGACSTPEVLPALAGLPLWIAYGEDDEFQGLTLGSKLIVQCLAPYGQIEERAYRLGSEGSLSAHVRTADAAYAEPDLYRWLIKQRRSTVQRSVAALEA